MYKNFRDKSIKQKLMTTIMGITCVVLFATTFIKTTTDYINLRKSIIQNLEITSDFTVQNIKTALDFLDSEAANENLQAFAFNPNIVVACVYDTNGTLFSRYESFRHKKDCVQNYEVIDDFGDEKFYFGVVDLHKIIDLGDNSLGVLYLEYDLKNDHWYFVFQEAMGLFFVLIAMVAAYFLSLWFQKPITEPILNLSSVAATLADKQDFSIRAKKQNNDELGLLVDAFNGMMEGMQERDKTILKAKEDAEDARDEATRANALKGEFLATMSHEIRTPMNGIIGMTELLLDTKLTHKQKNYAQTVINSSEALLNIINDILDFSKIEAGKLELEPIAFDLMQVVEDTADLLSIKAREKAIELIVRYVPGTPQYLVGDPGRIRQIISNLVGNAIKFTEKGYVLITVSEDKDAFLSDDQHRIKIAIKDTGIGIPKKAQDKLFQKFSQADASTTRKYGGTGLGLAICKQLSEMMGGDVGLKSEEGLGSTFWFTMNLNEDQSNSNTAFAPSILKDIRILIVDDIPINGELLEERFQSLGMRTTYLTDPQKAIDELNRGFEKNDPYKMAVLDYLMPNMNGEELAKEIKNNPDLENTALIMFTSAGGKGYTRRFQKAGFSACLSKPVRAKELIQSTALVWKEFSSGNTKKLIPTDHLSTKKKENTYATETIQFKEPEILLAEDNRTNQAFAQEILQSANCKVTIATNGQEAVNKLREKKYDLVFMDCEMPEMNGFEASRIIREMKNDKIIEDIPVVALTANAMKGDKERCIEAGMIDYLAKPMRKTEMLEMVKKYLFEMVDHETDSFIPYFGGYKLLLVEDNRTNRMMAEEMLEDLGFAIDIAENGKIAVDCVREHTYDVILMDVQMPIMDGFEATERIQKLIDQNVVIDVPIIALTANAMKGDREKCIEVGMIDYVTKPVRKNEIAMVIAKYLKPKLQDDTQNKNLENKNETDILDRDIFINYQNIMEEKFSYGIEIFLHEARLLIKKIDEGINQKDLKIVHMSSHSLKSSSASLGAMELSSLAEFLEEKTYEAIEENKEERFDLANVIDIENAFKRVATILDQEIRTYKANHTKRG